MNIGPVSIGYGYPVCIIAEIGPNHNGSLDLAKRLIEEAKAAGADVVKLQCYEPWEMTCDSTHDAYRLNDGPWAGKTLYELYTKAQTPWSWMPDLFAHARAVGIACFASVFSVEGVAYLESLGCPAYKIASAEVTHLELVRAVAATGKPVILSDGMADDDAFIEALVECWDTTNTVGLRCISEYPASPADYALRDSGWRHWFAIDPVTRERVYASDLRWGISDHTLTNEAAIASVALGACVIEKHLMLEEGAYMRRREGCDNSCGCLPDYNTPLDAGHSLTPRQFKDFVQSIRRTEAMLSSTERKISGSQWRRRLVFAHDLPAGHVITTADLKLVRCGDGVETMPVLGAVVTARAVSAGDPLTSADMEVTCAA